LFFGIACRIDFSQNYCSDVYAANLMIGLGCILLIFVLLVLRNARVNLSCAQTSRLPLSKDNVKCWCCEKEKSNDHGYTEDEAAANNEVDGKDADKDETKDAGRPKTANTNASSLSRASESEESSKNLIETYSVAVVQEGSEEEFRINNVTAKTTVEQFKNMIFMYQSDMPKPKYQILYTKQNGMRLNSDALISGVISKADAESVQPGLKKNLYLELEEEEFPAETVPTAVIWLAFFMGAISIGAITFGSACIQDGKFCGTSTTLGGIFVLTTGVIFLAALIVFWGYVTCFSEMFDRYNPMQRFCEFFFGFTFVSVVVVGWLFLIGFGSKCIASDGDQYCGVGGVRGGYAMVGIGYSMIALFSMAVGTERNDSNICRKLAIFLLFTLAVCLLGFGITCSSRSNYCTMDGLGGGISMIVFSVVVFFVLVVYIRCTRK